MPKDSSHIDLDIPNTSNNSSVIPSTKKSFFKRWWFWLTVISVSFVSFALFWNATHPENNNENQGNHSQISGEMGYAYDSSLPDCPADLSGLLTHQIFDLSDLDVVIPLGNLSPGVHTIPTDHMYLDHIGKKRMAIYAPGNMTLISMDNKITYDSTTDARIRDDWSIQFAVCKGLTLNLSHFSEIEPRIKSAFDASNQQCAENKIYFGVADQSMYYKPCQSQFMLSIKAGELMGYIGSFVGGGKGTAATGIDLGVYNHNGTPLPMAMPSRYSEDNLHAMCGLDLFNKELKDFYYSKLGDLVVSGENVSIEPRVGQPLCGAYNQDIPGTLAGNWFTGSASTGSVTSMQYQIALANTVANSSILEISLQGQPELGGNASIKFTSVRTGATNRAFSDITPGSQIYCYQSTFAPTNIKPENSGKTKVPTPQKYLIQLLDDTHIKIEKQTGSCGTSEQFNNPFIYER